MEYLSSLGLDDWRNISIVAQGLLMLFLVASGIYQLHAIRVENKKQRTYNMCNVYCTDPGSMQARKTLFEARLSGDIDANPLRYRTEVTQVLNYLDTIAGGIKQGIYLEEVVKKYMRFVVRRNVARYLSDDFPKKLRIPLCTYTDLLELDKKWGNPAIDLDDEHREDWELMLPRKIKSDGDVDLHLVA